MCFITSSDFHEPKYKCTDSCEGCSPRNVYNIWDDQQHAYSNGRYGSCINKGLLGRIASVEKCIGYGTGECCSALTCCGIRAFLGTFGWLKSLTMCSVMCLFCSPREAIEECGGACIAAGVCCCASGLNFTDATLNCVEGPLNCCCFECSGHLGQHYAHAKLSEKISSVVRSGETQLEENLF